MKSLKNFVTTFSSSNKSLIIKIIVILLLYGLISVFIYLLMGVLFK